MATVTRLFGKSPEIYQEVYNWINVAEAERNIEFTSALKIQSWFRAVRVRLYIAHLNASAVQIQKRWKAYMARNKYRELLKVTTFNMKLSAYNSMATLIQKLWRGYYTRKYISNYYSRKRYLEGLKLKNEIVRSELLEFAQQQHHIKFNLREKLDQKRLEQWCSKHHHLVSTTVMPGIFNSPFLPFPDHLEDYLKTAKPLKHKKEKDGTIYNPSCTQYDLPMPEALPPIPQKQAGPFRDPREVQRQRYRPFKPSLKVATSYTSVEEARKKLKEQEWGMRLNDDTFQNFTQVRYQYDPLLNTTSPYGHLPYGAKHFRYEVPESFIDTKDFKTIVPAIPIFDKLNETYSKGEV